MKDYSTFHSDHPEPRLPHLVEDDAEAEGGTEMDDELTRILGAPDRIKVPEAVLRRLWYRLRLLSMRYRN